MGKDKPASGETAIGFRKNPCYATRMLLKNAAYIGPDLRLHHDDLRIENTIISQIAPHLSPNQDEEVHDCAGMVLIPALADCHVHTPDTLFKGLFNGVPMIEWCNDTPQGRLQKRLFDYLDTHARTPEFRTLVLYAYVQYVKQGIACIVESGQADDSQSVLHACACEIGLKALVDYYDQYDPTIPTETTISIGTHLPEEEDLTPELLREVQERCAAASPWIMTHCLETDWRLADIQEKFGTSTVQVMQNAALLNEKSILFHCIQVTEQDIAAIGEAHATVVCCPISTLRGSEGLMPLQNMLAHKVNITIGTDFIEHDIWDSIRCLYTTMSDPAFPPIDREAVVFAMATSNAETIFKNNGYSGLIQLGASADICCIGHTAELDPLVELSEFSNVLHNVLMQGGKDMVKHLMVNGVFVVYDGVCQTIDEEQVVSEYRDLVARLVVESRA